jgi:hypothetical protein
MSRTGGNACVTAAHREEHVVTGAPHPLPRRRTDVELRDDERGTWLIDPTAEAAHVLNPTGRAIWELCDGTITIEELADAISEVFDVPRARAAEDVTGLVQQFDDAGLVTRGTSRESA